MSGEFSVYQFFADDLAQRTLQFVDAEAAVTEAKRLTLSIGAQIGTTKRVIVTDGGDHCCFEWINGRGVTFPPPESRT